MILKNQSLQDGLGLSTTVGLHCIQLISFVYDISEWVTTAPNQQDSFVVRIAQLILKF